MLLTMISLIMLVLRIPRRGIENVLRATVSLFLSSPTFHFAFNFYPHSKWNGFVNSIELVLGLAIERLDDYVI